MTRGLIRYHHTGKLHFITFSCFHRLPYLASPGAYALLETALEHTRRQFQFIVVGYVVMPEHVHMLIGEPLKGAVSDAIRALKISVTLHRPERPFWQARSYDFNVHNDAKRIEKLRYMHRNPVARGLVVKPEEWLWSSFRHYATGYIGTVEIESQWTAFRRGNQLPEPFRYKGKNN